MRHRLRITADPAPSPGRKLGGVLIESVSRGAQRVVVIGIGLNVLPLAVNDASSGVAALREIDATASAPKALHRLAVPLALALREFEAEGFAAFEARYKSRDLLFGRGVIAGTLSGTAQGVASNGALLLRSVAGTQRTTHHVISGEVSVRLQPQPCATATHPSAAPLGIMLRLLVFLLVLANAAFLAWSLGWLDDLTGVRARGDREPERLARQVRPESIRILPPGSVRAAPLASAAVPPSPAPAPAPAQPAPAATITPLPVTAEAAPLPACLEAGPFSTAQIGAAQALLQINLPSGSWTQVKTERPALWMVYMGKFNDAETMVKRQEELRRLKVEYDELRAPNELAPGLSLGRFEVRGNANSLLDQLSKRGVRNARVVESTPAGSSHMLRIDKPSTAVLAQLAALPGDALGKGFVPCAKP